MSWQSFLVFRYDDRRWGDAVQAKHGAHSDRKKLSGGREGRKGGTERGGRLGMPKDLTSTILRDLSVNSMCLPISHLVN